MPGKDRASSGGPRPGPPRPRDDPNRPRPGPGRPAPEPEPATDVVGPAPTTPETAQKQAKKGPPTPQPPASEPDDTPKRRKRARPTSPTATPIEGTFAQPGTRGAAPFRTASFSQGRIVGGDTLFRNRGRGREGGQPRLLIGSGTANPLSATAPGSLGLLDRRDDDFARTVGRLLTGGR